VPPLSSNRQGPGSWCHWVFGRRRRLRGGGAVAAPATLADVVGIVIARAAELSVLEVGRTQQRFC